MDTTQTQEELSAPSPLSASWWWAPQPLTGPTSPSYLPSRPIGRPGRTPTVPRPSPGPPKQPLRTEAPSVTERTAHGGSKPIRSNARPRPRASPPRVTRVVGLSAARPARDLTRVRLQVASRPFVAGSDGRLVVSGRDDGQGLEGGPRRCDAGALTGGGEAWP